MQPIHDQFVAAVAIGLGSLLILATAIWSPALFSLPKPRRLARTLGLPAARLVIGAIGLAIIAMGILIARGWRMPWQRLTFGFEQSAAGR